MNLRKDHYRTASLRLAHRSRSYKVRGLPAGQGSLSAARPGAGRLSRPRLASVGPSSDGQGAFSGREIACDVRAIEAREAHPLIRTFANVVGVPSPGKDSSPFGWVGRLGSQPKWQRGRELDWGVKSVARHLREADLGSSPWCQRRSPFRHGVGESHGEV